MSRPLCSDVPFGALVSITTRARSVFLTTRLRPLGLSAGQFPVLMLLGRVQNIIQDDLVRHYRLDKGTIARSVKKLEDAGYIKRTVDPGNRRAVRLFLTKKGDRVIPQLRAIDREWEERICAGLDDHAQQSLALLMHTVTRNSFCLLEDSYGGNT